MGFRGSGSSLHLPTGSREPVNPTPSWLQGQAQEAEGSDISFRPSPVQYLFPTAGPTAGMMNTGAAHSWPLRLREVARIA